MASALQYISNIGKSVTYSAIDAIKDMNPVISEFAEQNGDLGKMLYESVKDFKGTSKRAFDHAKNSKVGEFTQEYYKALMEDIKTGKLYNRERMDQMTIRATGSLLTNDMDDSDPFADMDSSFDDSNFDFGDDNSWELDDSDKFMADQIDRVGEKTANAISVATGRSAEYMVKSNKQSFNALQRHNEYLVGKINIGLGAVSSGISGIIEFNNKVMKPHVENSKKFYETSNKLDAERNDLLKKILEGQTNMYKSTLQEQKKSDSVKYGDIVSGYSPNLKMYGKRIMQNANSMLGGYMDMNNMFEGGNMLLTFAGSPLKFITDTLIKKMTPKMIEKSMGDLNETLSGFFGSLMSKFNSMRNNEEGGIGKWIAELFGIDSGTKSRVDPARYNKGAIPFDGETKMAITQVIPMHLSKIEAALTGQSERLFDYKKGMFTDLERVKREYEGISRAGSDRASGDLRSEMEALLKSVRFNDVKDTKKLKEQMSNMFEKSYGEGSLINFNKKDLSPSDLGIDDYKSFYIIQSLLKEVKKSTKMKYNAKVWEQKAAQDRAMAAEEANPTSIYRAMENGFNPGQYINTKDGKSKNSLLQSNLVLLKDNLGHNMYYYLQRLTEDVEKIRYTVLSGSGGRGRGGKYSDQPNPLNTPLAGVTTAPGFKPDSDFVNDQERKEQERYDRETIRMIEKARKFDTKVNIKYDKSSKKSIGKPFTVPEYIAAQRAIMEREPGFSEENFKNTVVKNAKADVKALNDRNSYQKDDLWEEKNYTDLDDEEIGKSIRSHIRGNKSYERSMLDIDESMADTKKNTLARRLKKKIMDSDKVGDGIKNLIMGLDDLSSKPVKTISGILQRVDERLYQVIYGDDDETGGKLSPKTFMGALVAKMTATFNSVTQFIKDDILLPVKDLLGGKDIKGHLKDLGTRFLNAIGINTSRFKGTAKNFGKKMFSSPLNYAKHAMSNVYSPMYKYIKGTEKEDYTGSRLQVAEDNNMAYRKAMEIADSPLAKFDEAGMNEQYDAMKYIKDSLASGKSREELEVEGYGEYMDNMYLRGYAKGSRRIRKTGLAVVSEGEMIVPAKYNPYYHGNKKTSTLSRREGAIQNRFNRAMRRVGGRGINSFADGEDNIIINQGRVVKGDGYDVEFDSQRYKYNSNNFYNEPLAPKMAKVYRNGSNKLFERLGLAGKEFKEKLKLKTKMEAVSDKLADLAGSENSDQLFNSAIKDVTSNFANYIPGVLGGGLVGSGISLITGAIGGPLIGAAVGAATGLITQSDQVKDWLFGKIDNKTGERNGNVISKELSNNFKKYFPNMAKGATVGGITSILPFVPGGPVAGIVLGASIGFATKSEKVQNMLFGRIIDNETGERSDKGLFKPEFIKNLKGSIPEMALGALGGVIAGPFGLVGNIALGASLGYLSKTKKFQEALFGKEVEKDGVITHEGGILGTIKTKFVDPLVGSIQPFAKELQLGVKSMFGALNGVFHSIFDEELRIPIRKYLKEKIFDRVVNTGKAIGKAVINPAINMASTPFKLIGAAGNHFRGKQIAGGNANYMTAQERLDFRKNRKGKLRQDNFDDFDQMLVDMKRDDLVQVSDSLKFLENPNEAADKQRAESISKINNAINYDYGLDYGTSKKILKHLRNDDVDSAFEVIRRSGLDVDKQRKLSMLISQEHANYTAANVVKADSKSSKNKMYGKLRKLGLKDIGDHNIDKYKKLVDQEVGIKKNLAPEEWKDNQDQKRHEQVVDLFKELIASIKDINDPQNKNVANVKRARFKNNMLEASKKRGFIGRFDNGDSGIFSNNYQYDYEVDESGNDKYFRYQTDDRGNMIPNSKVYVNELGTPINPEDRESEDGDSGAVNPNKAGYGAFAKAKAKVKSGASKLWNYSIGGALKKKKNNKMQSIIQSKADWDARAGKTFGTEDEANENITYRNDFFGNPIKWVKDKSGRWNKDDADGENKKYDEETKPLKKGFGWITDKLGNLASDIKNGIFSLFRIDEEDGTLKKFFKVALGGLGILTAAGAANVLEDWWDDKAAPAIHGFWEEKIMPRIQQYIEPIKPTLARAALGIDKAINSIPTAIEKLGDRIRGFVTEDLPRVWASKIIPFYKGGIEWLSEKAEKVTEGATYLMLKLLPSVLRGAIKGGWNLLKGDIFNLFGGLGRRDAKSLIGNNSSSGSTSFKVPSGVSDNMKNSSPMQGLYSSIFGSSAKSDLGYSNNSTTPVSDSALEDYYNMNTNSYPRTTTSSSKNANSSYVSGAGSTIMNAITSATGLSSNNIDYSKYAENVVGSDPIRVNNSTASSYNKGLTSTSQSSNNSSLGLGSQFSNPYVYDAAGNLYANNGDGSYINMETGETVTSQEANSNTKGFGKYSVGTRFAGAIGRAAITGRAGIWGSIARSGIFKPKKAARGFIGKAFNGLRYAADAGFQGIESAANLSNGLKETYRTAAGVYGNAAETTSKAYSGAADAAIKSVTGSNGVKFGVINGGKGASNISEEVAENLAESAVNASDSSTVKIINKFTKKLDNVIQWLYSKTIRKAAERALKQGGKEASQGAVKKILDAIAEKITKALKPMLEGVARKLGSKAALAIGKAIPYVNVVFFAMDFLDGFNNASTYLGITDENVTLVEKFICGIAQLVNGVVTLGLIPLNIIIDLFTDIIMPFFGIDTSELEALRAEAGRQLEIYNETQGTDYDLEQYNKRDNFWNSITGKYNKNDESYNSYLYYLNHPSESNTQTKEQIYADAYSNESYNRIYQIESNRLSSNSGNGSGLLNKSYSSSSKINKYSGSGSGINSRISKYIGGESGIGGDNIVEQVCIMIGQNESNSNYGALNSKDGSSGSMSIGKYQFNGKYDSNAKALIKYICNKNINQAKAILGEELYTKLTSGTLKGYSPTQGEALKIGSLLISSDGMKGQDEFMATKVVAYISSAKSYGITDPKAIMYFCDIYHQGGSGKTSDIVIYMRNARVQITLDNIYKYTAIATPKFYSDFKTRRDNSYAFCSQSSVMNANTGGYDLANIRQGYAYVQNISTSETSSGTTSGNWMTRLLSKVVQAGSQWLGVSDRATASVEDAITNTQFGLQTIQNTDLISDTAYNTDTETYLDNKTKSSQGVEAKNKSILADTKSSINDKSKAWDNLHWMYSNTMPYSGAPDPNPYRSGSQSNSRKLQQYADISKRYSDWNFNKLAEIQFLVDTDPDSVTNDDMHYYTNNWSKKLEAISPSYKLQIQQDYETYRSLWKIYGPWRKKVTLEIIAKAQLDVNNATSSNSAARTKKLKVLIIQYKYLYVEDTNPDITISNYVNKYTSTSNYTGNGSGFISQLDPRYAYNRIGGQTVAKAGCGPATAAMAINGLSGSGTDLMNQTTSLAQRYTDGGGVKASYFADVLGRAGANTRYINGSNKKAQIENSLASGKQVVLMGQDASNRSKANSPFGPGNHYVLAKGISGNKVLINDPELSGPRVYDKSILNNTKLGIAISGKGSSIFDRLYGKISDISNSIFGGAEREVGDAAVNENMITSATKNSGIVVSGNAANIITYARSFIGRIKYSQSKRYDIDKGGSYADCSSFVRHVFAKFGIQLGWYTGTQVSNGTEVALKDLKPGDLVMFKNTTSTSNPRNVTHVGIYTGNDTFIHCSSGSNSVVEKQLTTNDYYMKHWLCGRRIISDNSISARGSMILDLSAAGSKQYKPLGTIATITNAISRAESAKASSIKPILSNNTSISPFHGEPKSAGASNISSSDTTNKLLAAVVKLLSQMVDNTDNVKDIVGLLTKILEKAEEESKASELTQSSSSATDGRDKSGKGSKVSNTTSARRILTQYSQSDKLDMGNLISELESILTD